ncbi:MAG: hypothetical protein Q8R53_00885 [Nanoarchaeota archaeon]|nr:hypothetical protein [Nanoarchaeota archaeon]
MASTTPEKKVSRIKTKKKSWYTLFAPPLFGGKEIGETYRGSPEEALGTVLEINLRELTGDMKDQNAVLSFKVSRLEGSKLWTDLRGYALTPASVKRLVRKNTSRLDDRFLFHTKGGRTLIVKTLLITLFPTQRSLQTHLRQATQDFLKKEISALDFNEFMDAVIRRKVLLDLKKRLNKVYPVKEAVLRVIELQGEGKAPQKNEVSAAAEEERAAPASTTEESASLEKPDESAAVLEGSSEEGISPLLEEAEEAAAEA